MSDRNNDQELEKTTDATADEATSETETNELLTMVFTAHWHLPKPEKPTRPARPKQPPSLRPTHPPK